jgi:hypothetical protein
MKQSQGRGSGSFLMMKSHVQENLQDKCLTLKREWDHHSMMWAREYSLGSESVSVELTCQHEPLVSLDTSIGFSAISCAVLGSWTIINFSNNCPQDQQDYPSQGHADTIALWRGESKRKKTKGCHSKVSKTQTRNPETSYLSTLELEAIINWCHLLFGSSWF